MQMQTRYSDDLVQYKYFFIVIILRAQKHPR